LVLDQPAFLNAALEIDSDLDPIALLAVCKAVEAELGRRPGRRHGPRSIDVDILLLDGLEHESDRLRVPHRELLNRRFALLPLVELDAGLKLPGGTSLAAALAQVEEQPVTRLGPL
jgi:2-amino-4-hydroxy-6-hydroxymethyldihydropteridine diphosphokinase